MPNIPPPDAPPGWYRDPDQAETQRYWDGEDWTDQRAPLVERSSASWIDSSGKLTENGRFAIGLVLAGLGAVIAIIGVFLPLADTESNLHIAKNSMIQHPDGVVVIGVALAGALAAIGRATRPLTFLAGCALIGQQSWSGMSCRSNTATSSLDCPRFRRHLTAGVARLRQGGVDATHQAAIPAGVPT